MGSASGDINRHTPDAQIHRSEKITHLVGGRSTHRSVSKAKLAEVIPTPAFDKAIVEQGTRGGITCSNRNGCTPLPQVLRRQRIAHLTGVFAPRGSVAETKLPDVIHPQHFTSPLSSRAQVLPPPATICFAVRPTPRSTVGKASPFHPRQRPFVWHRRGLIHRQGRAVPRNSYPNI